MALHRTQVLTVALAAGLLAGTGSGCRYEEGLIIQNMKGTIVVPREAATRTFVAPDGTESEITDVRNIGPVYVGLYPDVEPENVIANYPHPEVGPIFQSGVQGDTYPYGGTTVGDLRFACFDALTCKVTSGRWASYDDLVDWFNNTLNLPVVDADGRVVEDGTYFQQVCFDLMEVTSDEEVQLLPADRNADDKLTIADLDFVENSEGDFEGDFTIWQQDFHWDRDASKDGGCEPGIDCPSFKVWAFMDGPGRGDASFVTCDQSDTVGFEVEEYNYDFFGGRVQEDVLNQPDKYIGAGDWIANQFEDKGSLVDGHYEWQNVYDRPTIRLGFEVTE